MKIKSRIIEVTYTNGVVYETSIRKNDCEDYILAAIILANSYINDADVSVVRVYHEVLNLKKHTVKREFVASYI